MATPTAPDLEVLRARLRDHSLYGALSSPDALRAFAEHHVVCVLDFMSLLKSLQAELTCVRVPWIPAGRAAAGRAEAGRFVQEIVLAEEFDVRRDGRVQSHFEWYVEAMEELGADTAPVRDLVEELGRGARLDTALQSSRLPAAARAFGLATARVLEQPLHVRAAVFLHGREELIPALFLPIVRRLEREGLRCDALVEYLERHIEVDSGEHGPLAERLLDRLCEAGPPGERRSEALGAARDALRARLDLWDTVAEVVAPLPATGGTPAPTAPR